MNKLLREKVTIIDEKNTYIDGTVKIDGGTVIYPNVSIRGNTIIGKNNIIDMNTIISDSTIGDDNKIISSIISNSVLGNENEIGPYAHIDRNTIIGNNVVIGNYVEIVRSTIDDRTKIKHLSYIGDTHIEENVNIGAGTITSNYSVQKTKDKTHIKKNAFIGSNSCLIAPLTIGENAVVAAGSTITDDIKDCSLVIARTRQVEKEKYYQKTKKPNR